MKNLFKHLSGSLFVILTKDNLKNHANGTLNDHKLKVEIIQTKINSN